MALPTGSAACRLLDLDYAKLETLSGDTGPASLHLNNAKGHLKLLRILF